MCADRPDTDERICARQTGTNAAQAPITPFPKHVSRLTKMRPSIFFIDPKKLSARSENRDAAFPLPEGKKIPALEVPSLEKGYVQHVRRSRSRRIFASVMIIWDVMQGYRNHRRPKGID